LAETLNDQGRLGWVSARIAHVFWTLGDYERAIDTCHRALTLATTLDDIRLESRLDMTTGYAHYALGNYHQARHFLEKNLAFLDAELMPSSPQRAWFMNAVFFQTWLVWCLTELGAFTEGIVCGEKAIRLMEALKQPYGIGHAYIGLGGGLLLQGELSQTIVLLERALALSCEMNFPNVWMVSSAQLGYAYALSGRRREALPLLEQAVEQGMGIRGAGHALWSVWLSETYLLADRIDDALALGQRTLEQARTYKERGWEAYTLRLLGETARHLTPQEISSAEMHYQQALTLANELGMRPLQAHCHRSLGTLYRQTRQAEQARAELIHQHRGR
ncbi:MAG: hypothetical protein OEU26_28275, partial [Candidatus Tectomicrobia bacterium]|nr:hypothetical protein [Candidatus Tectomicrobia bacterium]